VSPPWVVRLPSWLGDTVMALPVLRALARRYERPLLLWGPPQFAELLALSELRFDYLPYRRRGGVAGISDAIHACAALRHHKPAAALLLPNAFEPALLARAAGIPRLVGFATDGRGALLTDRVPEPQPRHAVHEAERFAALARHLGAELHRARDTCLAAGTSLKARAEQLLPPPRQLVALAAGSANTPAKRWPPDRWAALARAARERWGAEPVLLGSAADRTVNTEIAAAAGAPVTDLSGSSLTDLAAALLRCRVVVSNDSGAAHLAAAIGRPTVVLFGPTNPERTAPTGEHVHVVAAPCFCRPCGYRECPLDHRCLKELAPSTVLDAVAAAWEVEG
jgi:heptosyltransferase-2